MNHRKMKKLQRKVKLVVVLASTIYMAFGVTEHIVSKAFLSDEPKVTTAMYETLGINEPVLNSDYEEVGTVFANKAYSNYSLDKVSTKKVKEKDDFKEYTIPKEFSQYGGYFPLEVQKFTWKICKEYGIDYSLILAMIEVESGYQNNAISNCNAVGYMQIMEIWHRDRMKRLEATDLTNPYHNIEVGIDLMAELTEKYQTSVALSIYNRGFHNKKGTGALDLEKKGIYQTEYSKKVMKRADEIRKELLK